MNDSFGYLKRLERELGGIASQLPQLHFARLGGPERWQPAINAYRCGGRFLICADLAGADEAAVEVLASSRRLIIRGTRPAPEPTCDEAQSIQVLAMEIDYGPFERVLELPADVEAGQVRAEHHEGLLWIYLPMRNL